MNQKTEELNFILSKVSYNYNTKFLDLGCGEGDMTYLLHNMGYNCLGVDKINTLKFNVPFVESKAEEFDVSQFDIIIAYGLLEYVDSPIYLIKKLNNEMKKDAILIVSVPNVCSLSRRVKCLFGKNPNREKGAITWNFTFKDVKKMLDENWNGSYNFVMTNNDRIKNTRIPTIKNFSNPIIVICKK